TMRFQSTLVLFGLFLFSPAVLADILGDSAVVQHCLGVCRAQVDADSAATCLANAQDEAASIACMCASETLRSSLTDFLLAAQGCGGMSQTLATQCAALSTSAPAGDSQTTTPPSDPQTTPKTSTDASTTLGDADITSKCFSVCSLKMDVDGVQACFESANDESDSIACMCKSDNFLKPLEECLIPVQGCAVIASNLENACAALKTTTSPSKSQPQGQTQTQAKDQASPSTVPSGAALARFAHHNLLALTAFSLIGATFL
ncbi:hypothetical protein BKA62DRAFT_701977, partial [Auriculariales sp. MPI-PUGE-AT-0066]